MTAMNRHYIEEFHQDAAQWLMIHGRSLHKPGEYWPHRPVCERCKEHRLSISEVRLCRACERFVKPGGVA